MELNLITNEFIKIDRFIPYVIDDFEWNMGEKITMDDISSAIKKGQSEEVQMYNPRVPMSNEWHIGRVIHFINHPEEIKYIKIENANNEYFVYPHPVLLEGYHRFMAAYWLHLQGKLEEVYCIYDGRRDVLDFLKGEGRKPSKLVRKKETKDICNYCIENDNKEYYYEITTGKLVFGNDIKKAKKLTETVAKDMTEMFKRMYPESEYKIVKEKINY